MQILYPMLFSMYVYDMVEYDRGFYHWAFFACACFFAIRTWQIYFRQEDENAGNS